MKNEKSVKQKASRKTRVRTPYKQLRIIDIKFHKKTESDGSSTEYDIPVLFKKISVQYRVSSKVNSKIRQEFFDAAGDLHTSKEEANKISETWFNETFKSLPTVLSKIKQVIAIAGSNDSKAGKGNRLIQLKEEVKTCLLFLSHLTPYYYYSLCLTDVPKLKKAELEKLLTSRKLIHYLGASTVSSAYRSGLLIDDIVRELYVFNGAPNCAVTLYPPLLKVEATLREMLTSGKINYREYERVLRSIGYTDCEQIMLYDMEKYHRKMLRAVIKGTRKPHKPILFDFRCCRLAKLSYTVEPFDVYTSVVIPKNGRRYIRPDHFFTSHNYMPMEEELKKFNVDEVGLKPKDDDRLVETEEEIVSNKRTKKVYDSDDDDYTGIHSDDVKAAKFNSALPFKKYSNYKPPTVPYIVKAYNKGILQKTITVNANSKASAQQIAYTCLIDAGVVFDDTEANAEKSIVD